MYPRGFKFDAMRAPGGQDEPIGGDVSVHQADMDILNDEGGGDDATGGGEKETPEGGKGKEDEGSETEEEDEGAGGEGDEKDDEAPDDVEDVEGEEEPEEKEEPEDKEDKDKATIEPGLAKKVKAAYPEFFKKFPEVRRAIFRDQQYAEVIPTPEDARDLVEQKATFDEYERHVVAGSPALLLKGLADMEDPKVLEKFAMNFIPSIEKLSPELRGRMIFPYLRKILVNAKSDAESSQNKNLANSIGHITRYLFGSPGIPDDKAPTEDQETPEAKQLKVENQRLRENTRMNFQSRVFSNGLSELKNKIDQTFKKDERFTKMELRAMSTDTFNRVRRALDKDPRHKRVMQSLWAKADTDGYPEHFVPRISNAFLGGANNLMQSVRARVVTEALREKGIAPPVKGQGTGTPRGGAPQKSGKGVNAREIDYRNTSDADILGDDPSKIKLKKR